VGAAAIRASPAALVGASKVSQVDDNVAALKNLKFSAEELGTIDGVLASKPSAWTRRNVPPRMSNGRASYSLASLARGSPSRSLLT